ncbi:MAG: hypothetical protein ACO2Y5_04440 [Nitrosopumilaceae archaeon]
MKRAQLLSIVFSLIMFTGITAGSAVAYADSDDDYEMDDLDDKLEYYCEMNDDEKAQLFNEYDNLASYTKELDDFCTLDEDEREDQIEIFIAERYPEYAESDDEYERDDEYENDQDDYYETDDDYEKNDDYKRDYDMEEVLEKYCEMTGDDKVAFIEDHGKSAEHQEKMEEYCLLDESEKDAFIDALEDQYEKRDYDPKEIHEKYCEMNDEEKDSFIAEHEKLEEHKEKLDEYCTLDESEREAFIEEHQDEHKKYDKKGDHDAREKMDEFCEMEYDEKLAHLEEYDKLDRLSMMEEYCALDDEGRDAFIEENSDSMKKDMPEHKESMKEKISEHKESMKSEDRKKIILRASTLNDEQKDSIKAMHEELRDLKHSLRDKSISDTDKEDLRDQFMELAKEFSMTWLSPRHQTAAGIDAQLVECREGFELVMKTSNASPMCVKETTADKLVKRGIAILAT